MTMAKCVSCSDKGIFFKVDGDGLCKTCSPKVKAEIDKHTEIIYEEMHLHERGLDKAEKLRALDAILASAEVLSKYEDMGLDTCSPPPRLVLPEYRGFREELLSQDS